MVREAQSQSKCRSKKVPGAGGAQAVGYIFSYSDHSPPSILMIIMMSPTPSLTLTDTETLFNECNAPQDLKSGSKRKQLTKTKSGFTWKSTRRIEGVDDEEGKAQFFFALLFER